MEGPLKEEQKRPVGRPGRGAAARKQWVPWAVAAVLLLALVAGAVWFFKPSPPLAITRFPFMLGEGQVFTTTGIGSLTISPDGSQMAYVANQRLYLRSMAELEARPIPGTDLGGIRIRFFRRTGNRWLFSRCRTGRSGEWRSAEARR